MCRSKVILANKLEPRRHHQVDYSSSWPQLGSVAMQGSTGPAIMVSDTDRSTDLPSPSQRHALLLPQELCRDLLSI